MPSMYAHQKFGNDVLCLLPKEVRGRIAKQEDLYHIGLQGPDIFFYHKPLSWGEIPQYGNHLHDLTGHAFWEKLLTQYAQLDDFGRHTVASVLQVETERCAKLKNID